MHVINPFVFLLDIYNVYLRGKAFISWECRILGSKLYSSLLFLQNNPLGFGLAGFYFFSKSILFSIDLYSTDLSLRKLWAPLQWPFNLKLPGSQSPWELQNIFFFNLAVPSTQLLPLRAVFLSPDPGSSYSLWKLEVTVVRLSPVGAALMGLR